jgi:hypothetical protein
MKFLKREVFRRGRRKSSFRYALLRYHIITCVLPGIDIKMKFVFITID